MIFLIQQFLTTFLFFWLKRPRRFDTDPKALFLSISRPRLSILFSMGSIRIHSILNLLCRYLARRTYIPFRIGKVQVESGNIFSFRNTQNRNGIHSGHLNKCSSKNFNNDICRYINQNLNYHQRFVRCKSVTWNKWVFVSLFKMVQREFEFLNKDITNLVKEDTKNLFGCPSISSSSSSSSSLILFFSRSITCSKFLSLSFKKKVSSSSSAGIST